MNPNLFNKYVDYLLGEHVHGLKAKDANGETMSSPSLELVLSYDFQVRKAMTKAMNEGVNMVRALEDAMKDTTVKERYFLTPAAMGAASKESRQKSRSPRREWSGDYGQRGSWENRSKNTSKGKKGKGKGKAGRGLHTRTPDGRDICFAWNNRDQRCRYNCGRVHCCQLCFGNHPAHSCKEAGDKKPGGKDTAGGGGDK